MSTSLSFPPFPKLIEYSDSREFLRDFYKFKKSQNKNFSYRKFNQLVGIKSSNYLKLVMAKKRNLSLEMARSLARAMKLSLGERDYFLALVKMQHSTHEEEREKMDRERKMALKKIIAKDIPMEKAEYLSVWFYPLVRELVFLPDFNLSASWVSHKLGGIVSEAQAERAIRVLINLGLWQMEHGRYKASETFLDTGAEDRVYEDINISNIHRQNLLAWTKIIEDLSKEKRELGLINIPINPKKIPEFKKRIQQFQDEIIGWLQDESEPTEIVQLGTYLLQVTHSKGPTYGNT